MPTHEELAAWFDEREERFVAIAHDIWARPALPLSEHYACARQADDLAADGFTITRNVGDLPTAFMAEWGSGVPLIGFLGSTTRCRTSRSRPSWGRPRSSPAGRGMAAATISSGPPRWLRRAH